MEGIFRCLRKCNVINDSGQAAESIDVSLAYRNLKAPAYFLDRACHRQCTLHPILERNGQLRITNTVACCPIAHFTAYGPWRFHFCTFHRNYAQYISAASHFLPCSSLLVFICKCFGAPLPLQFCLTGLLPYLH
jgi:hypothetical protein